MHRILQKLRFSANSTFVRRYGSGHAEGYEPGGYIFGRPPLKPGEKRKKYFWETMWYYGYYGPFIIFFLAEYYSPKHSIVEEAKIEAQKRMAMRGETFGWPFPANYALVEVRKEGE
ncbi:hypothetical protein HK099_003961 [Clydaea vesicula]|uniref:NADH-ubiquinone oxidoreductase ESSS subunit n=1 Tax=Clydaea vesicula TaxID=447962 RepID=A0AAD5U748_9FUNG|nr:hypothetical protein HK099_003961 [Clydaea vesicula]KAJ3394382.1 hypothetical protein HDU92_006961 [Lobulomyces angularis]